MMISFRSNGFESLHASATPTKLNFGQIGERKCLKKKFLFRTESIGPTALAPARNQTHTLTLTLATTTFSERQLFFPSSYRFASVPKHTSTHKKKVAGLKKKREKNPWALYSNSPSFSLHSYCKTRCASHDFTLVSRRHAQSIASYSLHATACVATELFFPAQPIENENGKCCRFGPNRRNIYTIVVFCRANCNYRGFLSLFDFTL